MSTLNDLILAQDRVREAEAVVEELKIVRNKLIVAASGEGVSNRTISRKALIPGSTVNRVVARSREVG